MTKRKVPVAVYSHEYADCLEKSFTASTAAAARTAVPGAASGGAAGGAGAADRGAMGNTPLYTSPLGRISEDTVHLSIWANWGIKASELFNRLRDCQPESKGAAEQVPAEESSESFDDIEVEPDLFEDLAKRDSSGWESERFIEGHGSGYMEFGGRLWKVLPYGMGGKDGRAYYPYHLVNGGVHLGFRREKHETVSNMWVEMGSLPLCQMGGVENLWQDLCAGFASEGIIIERDIVSRVDVYADFDGVGVEEFCRRFTERCKVSRARSISLYSEEMNTAMYFEGTRWTGFSVGSNIRLRCYDKRHELRNDPIKRAAFAARYDGIPEQLTRIEFQLRRTALKEFISTELDRVDAVADYVKARDRLWKYLTDDWFRLTENTVDGKNNHQSRAKTWTVWERVQNAVSCAAKEMFRLNRELAADFEHLFRMAVVRGMLAFGQYWRRLISEELSGKRASQFSAQPRNGFSHGAILRLQSGKGIDEYFL